MSNSAGGPSLLLSCDGSVAAHVSSLAPAAQRSPACARTACADYATQEITLRRLVGWHIACGGEERVLVGRHVAHACPTPHRVTAQHALDGRILAGQRAWPRQVASPTCLRDAFGIITAPRVAVTARGAVTARVAVRPPRRSWREGIDRLETQPRDAYALLELELSHASAVIHPVEAGDRISPLGGHGEVTVGNGIDLSTLEVRRGVKVGAGRGVRYGRRAGGSRLQSLPLSARWTARRTGCSRSRWGAGRCRVRAVRVGVDEVATHTRTEGRVVAASAPPKPNPPAAPTCWECRMEPIRSSSCERSIASRPCADAKSSRSWATED